jgi:hypothetical protein
MIATIAAVPAAEAVPSYEAGRQHVTWDGRSDLGSPVASGVYFYRIVANDFRATRRMTLLK